MKKVYIAILIILFSATACGLKKIPLTGSQKVYQGYWVSGDNFIEIKADGSVNLKDGPTKVNNGPIRFKGNQIKIKFLGIGKEYTIDKAPNQIGGKWKMTLSGVTYTKR